MFTEDSGDNPSGPRLLVVDDNDDNRYTLTLQLEIEGYQDIATADDGDAALAMLGAREFDLVLLDVMMPKLDGYQVLERLKKDGRLHELPVIMISALNEIDSVVRCIELGAIDYLPKPLTPCSSGRASAQRWKRNGFRTRSAATFNAWRKSLIGASTADEHGADRLSEIRPASAPRKYSP